MAISPDPDDTRLRRFPRDWFLLPWQERNQKFNDLINIELEKAKEYLNVLPKLKDECRSNERQTSPHQSNHTTKTLSLSYPEVYEKPEKVDANDLIKELDLLIKAGEKVQEKLEGSDSVKKRVKKKKTHKPKKTKLKKEQDKRQNEVPFQSVKPLEEHLRDFLGSDLPYPFAPDQPDPWSQRSRRPPGRRGSHRETKANTCAVSVNQQRDPKNLDGSRTPPRPDPASASATTPSHEPNLVSATNLDSKTTPLSNSTPHGELIPKPSRLCTTSISESRPSEAKPRPRHRPPVIRPRRPAPPRLPPIPQCLVPVVSLSIDDSQEHARTLLARGPRISSYRVSSFLPPTTSHRRALNSVTLRPDVAPSNYYSPVFRCDARRPLPPLQRRADPSGGVPEITNPQQKMKNRIFSYIF